MIRTALLTALATLVHTATVADELPADKVIADINSTGWAVDPWDFGMSAMEYQRKEADIFALNMIDRSGLNEFYHFQGLTTAADTWVVTPNVDTVYSIAVIDARDGFSIELPDVGARFISLHVQDQNHTFVAYSWDAGLHDFPAGSIETDYVIVGIRTGTDATPEDVDYINTVLQPAMVIKSNSAVPYETDTTEADIAALREALLVEWAKLPNMYDTVQFDINDVSDWEKWTYTIAGSWGLSPESTAMYVAWAPENTKADTCYTATFDKVPANAFASLTLYNADNYLMTDTHNVVSTGRESYIENDDGSFTIIFGGAECQTLAEERSVNYAQTPEDGWRGQVRAYRPDVETMKAYALPELREISTP